jgi:hypothetical protein
MGLLTDFLGQPNSDQSQALGLLGAHLMAGQGPQGFLAANQLMADAPRRRMQQEIAQMQIEQQRMATDKARRDEAQEQQILGAAKGAYRSPEMANALSMGPTPDGGAVPQVAPGFDSQQFLSQLYGINPMKAVAFEQSIAKDNSPLTVAPGASLVDRKTLKPVFTAPKEAAPTEVGRLFSELQALPPGDPRRAVYENAIRKATTHQPGTQVNVNTEKPLLNEIAGGLGKAVTDARGGAQAALGTINTVNRLMDALDSGKVMAGPTTTFRQSALQLGSLLGVSGKDAQEKMLNTRQAIQSLAQLELDAAQQMKGQGQITEAERAIIRRAASGDIDGMTTGELRLLGGVLDRTARFKIRNYNQQAAPLKNMPNAAPLAPFLDVAEPEARKSIGGAKFLGFE